MFRLNSIAIFFLFLLAASATAQTCASSSQKIDSPRIERLRGDVLAGDTTAVGRFWEEMKGKAPLWEFIPPENEGFFWMTFVWRGDDHTCNVALEGGPESPGERQKPLSHLSNTDVWYRTERVPWDSRFAYDFVVTQQSQDKQIATDEKPDPLNPKMFDGDSVAEMPLTPEQLWLKLLPGVTRGKVQSQSFYSNALNQERPFSVYTPAGASSAPYDLLIIFDGDHYLSPIDGPTIFDNLIAKHKIRPLVAVFLPGNFKDSRGISTRQDDLTCNDQYSKYVTEEIVPWIRKHYNVTRLPSRSVILGESLGGLQATYVAFKHPEIFSNVISFSGSFFYFRGWPAYEQSFDTQTGWLTGQFADAPRKPIKLYLATGTFEGPGVMENRRMRDVLRAKGYTIKYREYNGGHERLNWQGLLPEALIWSNETTTESAVRLPADGMKK